MPEVDSLHVATGTVVDGDRVPVADAEIRGLWRRFRKDVTVGKTQSDARGCFRLELNLPDEFPLDGRIVLEAVRECGDPKQSSSTDSVRLAPRELDDLLGVVLRFGFNEQDEYTLLRSRVEGAIGRLKLVDLREDDEHSDLSFLAEELGLSPEQILKLIMAERVADQVELPTQAVYASLRLGVPSSIPSDLMAAADRFTMIEPLTEHIAGLIADAGGDGLRKALTQGAQRRLVPEISEKELKAIVERSETRGVQRRLGQPLGVGKASMRELLKLAGLDDSQQQRFAAAWKAHLGSAERFWTELEESDVGIGCDDIARVRRTLEVGALVKNHPPMIKAIESQLGSKVDTSLSELARFDLKDWVQFVRKAGDDAVPPNILPSADESPAELFAREVYERVQRRYPTSALAARFIKERLAPDSVESSVERFFEDSPALDLVQANLGTWLEEHREEALRNIDESLREPTLVEVGRMQRVLRISRDPEIGTALIASDLDSASKVVALGRTQTLDRLQDLGIGRLEAQRVYSVSSMRHASSMALLTQYNAQIRGIYPAATGPAAPFGEPIDDAIRRHPSLANLFGAQDACDVDPCTSILSPSAYLTDLFLWLRNRRLRSSSPFSNGLEALRDRRPDLFTLKLDCENANTPLPYIDLVNELLEDAVSPPAVPVERQTTRTAKELRAAPEYVNDEAYTVLAEQRFPRFLPYERAFDELQVVLDQSKVPLWQLREVTNGTMGAPGAAATSVAAARFGIGAREQSLMTTPASAAGAAPLTEVWNTADPVNDLAVVAEFLQAAQLSYSQLLELLACEWPRAGGDEITIVGADDTCDTSVQRLETLSPQILDRIHRFLRLWHRTGWDMWALDAFLMAPAVANGLLDDAALRALLVVVRLQEQTGRDEEEVLAFWQDIGTSERLLPDGSTQKSLYARLFEDPLLPPDPALDLSTLLSTVPPRPLDDVLPALRAALSLSPDEAEALAATTDGQLTLETLSRLYRMVTLIRSLNLTLEDATYLAGGDLASAFATPQATLEFVVRARDVRSAGLRVPQLRYILTGDTTSATRTEDEISERLDSIRTTLQQASDDTADTGDGPLETLQRLLATLPSLRDSSLQETAVAIVDGSFGGSDGDRNAFIATHFGLFADVAAAQSALDLPLTTPPTPVGPREAEIDARANALLTPLIRFLTERRVIAAVAAGFSLREPLAEHLLRALNRPGSTDTLLATLADANLIARDPATGNYLADLTPTDLPDAFLALRMLDMVSIVARGLRLSADELAWLIANSTSIGGINLAELPALPAQPDQTVAQWLATALFLMLDRSFDAAEYADGATYSTLRELVLAILDSTIADEAAIHTGLAAITGWAEEDIAVAAAALGIVTPATPAAPNPWLEAASYDRLRRFLAMSEPSGASAAELLEWGAALEPTQAQAEAAWQALRSRYSNETWLDIAPKIMDPIRERRRDALVWYLLAQRGSSGEPLWGVDTADLFGRFLLDTEMSSCQVTSRIVQAYGSVQLFVQRILMNLERDVEAHTEGDDSWGQWSWMDRFRVWEAGRKVFLYPENWLIESQRPDRSEIFVDFDRSMQQREATKDGLETAALGYMDQLAQVAQLKITGMCSEPRSGNLYVVGRSSSDPAQFFLRTFSDRRWSHWSRIPVDITGQFVVPAFYAGRVHLFWIQTIVATEARQRLPGTDGTSRDSEAADRYIEIKVYSTSIRDDQWQPPMLAAQSLFDKPIFIPGQSVTDRDVEALYTLKTQPQGAYLLVDVYRTGTSDPNELAGAVFADLLSDTFEIADLLDSAIHLGRVVFDGLFTEFRLRNLTVSADTGSQFLRTRAQELYGSRARDLILLAESEAEPPLPREFEFRNEAGALRAFQRDARTELELRFETTVNTGTLLRRVNLPYQVIGLTNDAPFTPESPFVMNDPDRTWFVEPTRYWRNGSVWTTVPPSAPGTLPTELRFRFHRLYHPFVRSFRHVLSSRGFDALYESTVQSQPGDIIPDPAPFSFSGWHIPVTRKVRWGSDRDTVEFEYDAPYAGYNWETFLHLPLTVAKRLAQNQRFDEAREWFHYVFNPTLPGPETSPQRYWITRPFNELSNEAIQSQRINEFLAAVNRREPAALGQVSRWRQDPFNPYLLADLRPVAHMKHVVMSYLDNLIAWGDALFATESREALNEATLLYVMAAELLGPRPQLVPPPPRDSASWDELEPQLDDFANALVEIENYVPPGTGGGSGGGDEPPLPPGQTFYFKIPPNEKLLGYWHTVEDRLFKLRHCRGLGGEALDLALFDAPIDPALLVRARAGGLDLGAALFDLSAPLPNYRFTEIHRRAMSYTAAVNNLGRSLLGAIESRDSEALAALMMQQRRQINADSEQVLRWELEHAEALERSIDHVVHRYESIISDAEEAPFMSELEIASATMKSLLVAQKLVGMTAYLISAGVAGIPTFLAGAAGVGGSPQAAAETGGPPIADAIAKGAKAAEKFTESIEKGADLIKVFAEAEKNKKKKDKEGELAEYDRDASQERLEAAGIRVQIAQYHLEHLNADAERLDAERDFLQSKFANEDLFDWMVNQLSALYFRAFRLAMSMARRAERCYRFELGLVDSDVIGPSQWDSLRRGLLAGESLAHDLRRLESSYLERNVRRKEITRTVSLLEEFPGRLFDLLVNGHTELDLDELFFDRDYPGHYQRRLVRAGITVSRPDSDEHDNVVCELTLVRNTVRLVPTLGAGYPRLDPPDSDTRFADQFAPVQSIVTGNAIDDPGLFQRDVGASLRDPRYVPFENAGAIGQWRIELPAGRNSLDLATVTDVKLHLHYSALDGGETLQSAAQAVVDAALPSTLSVGFNVEEEFPEVWAAFLDPTNDQRIILPLRSGLLPAVARGRSVVINSCRINIFNDAGRRFEVALDPPFPTDITPADPAAPGAILATASIPVPAVSIQPLGFRIRERGSSTWTSLAEDALAGVVVELELGLS